MCRNDYINEYTRLKVAYFEFFFEVSSLVFNTINNETLFCKVSYISTLYNKKLKLMKLQVQKELIESGLEKVVKKYNLKANKTGNLVSLKYTNDTPKYSQVGIECRGLILELDTWNIVSMGFKRFFNYRENPDDKFDSSNFKAYHKEDGSIIYLFKYDGEVLIATSGMIGGDNNFNADPNDTNPITAKQLFWDTFNSNCSIDDLDLDNYVYTFELCSPKNKVVIQYDKPTLFLLTVRDKNTWQEIAQSELDSDKWKLNGILRPMQMQTEEFDSIENLCNTINTDANFVRNGKPISEGLILIDSKGRRLKLKTEAYLALHRSLSHYTDVLKVLALGEKDEVLAVKSEQIEKFNEVEMQIQFILDDINKIALYCSKTFDTSQSDARKYISMYVSKHKPRYNKWLTTIHNICFNSLELCVSNLHNIDEKTIKIIEKEYVFRYNAKPRIAAS